MVIINKDNDIPVAPRNEVDVALDKIFAEMTNALQERKDNKITLDQVDNVLNELFDAINRAKFEGKKLKVPDFKRIINDEF